MRIGETQLVPASVYLMDDYSHDERRGKIRAPSRNRFFDAAAKLGGQF